MTATAMDDPRARTFGRGCLELCEAHGAELSRSWALWVVGLEEWRRGEARQAIDRITEGLRLKARVDDVAGTAHCLEVLAWATAEAGSAQDAARLLGAADALWRKIGSSLTGFGYFRRFHDPCVTRVREVLGDAVYDRLFQDGRQVDDFLERFTSASEPAAPASAAPASAALSPLTPRERQVAELVSQGMSNSEIAAALVIAQRTAEGHMERILSKLGFASRAQVAAWVIENRQGA
jgi:DNA-binding CsgD family transcriptional regulator